MGLHQRVPKSAGAFPNTIEAPAIPCQPLGEGSESVAPAPRGMKFFGRGSRLSATLGRRAGDFPPRRRAGNSPATTPRGRFPVSLPVYIIPPSPPLTSVVQKFKHTMFHAGEEAALEAAVEVVAEDPQLAEYEA
jgi:hypothetical protein